ncbi:MAG: dual specificity protein phosphatase family protein [Bacteroidota bacterium]
MKFKILILCSWVCFPIMAQQTQIKQVQLDGLKRMYQLNDSVFRSEQPNKKEFIALESFGVKTVLNLRKLRDDKRKARDTGLTLEHLRLKSKKIDQEDIISALRIIKNASKPVLIHCWHGSDRTGVITAAYRIVFENWTKAEAIAEFRRPEFGYHENWYPNLIDVLQNLNVDSIKKELAL